MANKETTFYAIFVYHYLWNAHMKKKTNAWNALRVACWGVQPDPILRIVFLSYYKILRFAKLMQRKALESLRELRMQIKIDLIGNSRKPISYVKLDHT